MVEDLLREAGMDEEQLEVVVDESVDELLRGDYESEIPESPEPEDAS